MLHAKIEAGAASDDVASALEDAAGDIAELRIVTARLAGTAVGSTAFIADQAYVAELIERIGSRAARVELPEGSLTADQLLAFANEQGRDGRRAVEARRRELARAMIDATQRTAASRRALTKAEQEHHANLQTEAAAWAAYRAIDNG